MTRQPESQERFWSLRHPVQTPPSGAQVELQALGFPGSPPRPPPPERMKNNFYWPPLPGDRETSGAVLGPGHVSPGGPQFGAATANSGKAELRRPVRPGRRPTAPPQPAEAWASSQAERPPGPSAEASSLSCDAAAAETPQKRRAAEGVRASPPRLAPARASPESPGGEGGKGGGGRAWRRARARHKGFRATAPESPDGRGHRFRGPREGWRERSARRAHSRSRTLGRPAVAARRTGPRRPPSPARGPRRPARPLAARALRLSRPASILDRRFQPPRRCRRIPPLSRPPPPPPLALTSAAHPGAVGRRPSFPPKVSGVLFPMWGGCYGVVAGGSGAGAAPSTELQS